MTKCHVERLNGTVEKNGAAAPKTDKILRQEKDARDFGEKIQASLQLFMATLAKHGLACSVWTPQDPFFPDALQQNSVRYSLKSDSILDKTAGLIDSTPVIEWPKIAYALQTKAKALNPPASFKPLTFKKDSALDIAGSIRFLAGSVQEFQHTIDKKLEQDAKAKAAQAEFKQFEADHADDASKKLPVKTREKFGRQKSRLQEETQYVLPEGHAAELEALRQDLQSILHGETDEAGMNKGNGLLQLRQHTPDVVKNPKGMSFRHNRNHHGK